MEGQTPENDFLRQHAEQLYAGELEALKRQDPRPRPEHWELSPWAVCTYLLGGTLEDGFVVSPKYIGSRRLIEVAVATLDRPWRQKEGNPVFRIKA